MVSTNSIIIFSLLLSATTSIISLVMVWQRKPNRGYLAWVVFLFGSFFWAASYALHWMDPNLASKQFWLDLTYVGVVLVPGSAFVFVFEYLGYNRWVRKIWYLFN